MSRSIKRKTIVLRTKDAPKPPRRPEPCPAIIEVEHDGYFSVYGPDHLRVAIVNKMADEDSPELVSQIEAFHLEELPRSHRQYYQPRFIRATGLVDRRTIQSEANVQNELAMLRGIRAVGESLREGGGR